MNKPPTETELGNMQKNVHREPIMWERCIGRHTGQ